MAKAKKHLKKLVKQKLKLKKKLKQAVKLVTLTEIKDNLGAMPTIRSLPGSTDWLCWLSNTRLKKCGAKHFSGDLKSCCGVGATPSKALRNLLKKLPGKALCPEDKGPCQDGRKEMIILGKVLPL